MDRNPWLSVGKGGAHHRGCKLSPEENDTPLHDDDSDDESAVLLHKININQDIISEISDNFNYIDYSDKTFNFIAPNVINEICNKGYLQTRQEVNADGNCLVNALLNQQITDEKTIPQELKLANC
jgi:hypothetical protein